MKTEAIQSPRVSLFQVVNDSQTPIDQGVLRILYKGDADKSFTQPETTQVPPAASWDHAWYANYE